MKLVLKKNDWTEFRKRISLMIEMGGEIGPGIHFFWWRHDWWMLPFGVRMRFFSDSWWVELHVLRYVFGVDVQKGRMK